MIDSSINRRSNLIIKSFNSPSEIISNLQKDSEIGYISDHEKSIWVSSFGEIQISINDDKNEIEINPIEETQNGWENLINYINQEDKRIMEIMIEKFSDFGSISLRELKEEEIDGFKEGKWEYDF